MPKNVKLLSIVRPQAWNDNKQYIQRNNEKLLHLYYLF